MNLRSEDNNSKPSQTFKTSENDPTVSSYVRSVALAVCLSAPLVSQQLYKARNCIQK